MSHATRRAIVWKDLGAVRGLLYGISIIGVMAFHYTDGVVGAYEPGSTAYELCRAFNNFVGSIGVDVFVILSGFGIYHSLNRSFDLRRYYGRRVTRVLLPYAIAGAVFWLAKDVCVLGLGLPAFVRDYTWVSFFTDGVRTVWYVPFILCMYLVAPLLFKLVDHGVPAIVLAAAALFASLALSTRMPGLYWHIEIALMRVPAFLLGMGCGHLATRREGVPAILWLVLPLGIILKILVGNDYGVIAARMVNVVYAASVIELVVLLHVAAGDRQLPWPLRKALEWAGACSFELYLTHVMLRNLLGTVGGNLLNPLLYAACMAASLPLAILLCKVQRIGSARNGTIS